MSEFFDDLARTLAQPMPRRRALRLLGGAVVASAVPGVLRPSRAPGATRTASTGVTRTASACPRPGYCPSGRVDCSVCPGGAPGSCFLAGCGAPGSECCCLKDAAGRKSGATLCAPGYRCVPQGDPPCVCKNTCGVGNCCKPGEYCANFSQRLCCKEEERGCGLQCCKPNEECKTIRVGTGSQDFCEKRCPPKQAWCGRNKCCPPRWHCINERTGLCKRCRRNEEECGNKCCDKATSRCCGENLCCQKGRACCTVDGKRICCPPRTKCAPQILAGQSLLTRNSPRVCCPRPRFSTAEEICCPPGQVALNTPGFAIPPPGISPFCCPPGQICPSAVAGKACVDLRSDPRNCGSCGNVCQSGICSGGVCALP